MRIAHVPAAQIEIGEQEYDQGRAERRLDAGAPNALGLVLEAEYFAPETEVDADIGQHRPRQSRGGRKYQRAADDENDREKQREQACNADDNSLIEGEPRRLLLEGLRLPEVDLREVRRTQFGDISDRRAGIERQ